MSSVGALRFARLFPAGCGVQIPPSDISVCEAAGSSSRKVAKFIDRCPISASSLTRRRGREISRAQNAPARAEISTLVEMIVLHDAFSVNNARAFPYRFSFPAAEAFRVSSACQSRVPRALYFSK